MTHLPMVKHREAKRLSLGVSAKVGLKSKRVNGRDERFNGVERGAGDWCVLCHVTSSSCQHGVNG